MRLVIHDMLKLLKSLDRYFISNTDNTNMFVALLFSWTQRVNMMMISDVFRFLAQPQMTTNRKQNRQETG